MDEVEEQELLYFADPMCSWCWGFAPTVERLAARLASRAPLAVIVGGLHPGNDLPMDEATKASIREHWEHVRDASGQPFDFAFFDRPRFVYDTEPSCRAVVAARRLAPSRALAMLDRIHRAFYAENRDVTDADVLVALGAEVLGVDEAAFRESFGDEETEAETLADFRFARELGVRGFPTLLARKGDEIAIVTTGWQPLDKVEPALEAWLDP